MQHSLCEQFIKLRKLKGYTQQQLADIVGVSKRAVGAWENGTLNPTFEHAEKVFGALGYHIEIVPDMRGEE